MFALPEPGEEIGRHLPGARIVKGRRVTNTELVLWNIDGVVQRGLWYWLIADITADFAVNWTTAIMQSDACDHTPAGRIDAHGPAALPFVPDQWIDLGSWTTDLADPPAIWDGISIHVPAGQTATVTLSGTPRTSVGPPIDGGSLGVKRGGLGTDLVMDSGWPIGAGSDPDDIIVIGRLAGPQTYTPVGYIHGGVLGEWRALRLSVGMD